MRKYLRYLILFVIFSFFFSLDAICDVSMFIKSPHNVKAGEFYNVEITINKNDIQGFSKFEIEFPIGFEIEPMNCSNATFIFKNNVVKYIWMELPSSENINISYKAKVPFNYKGEKRIKAVFHYIYNKEKYSQNFTSLIDIENNLQIISPVKRNIEKNYNDLLAKINYKTKQVVFRLQIGAYTNKLSSDFLNEICPSHYRIKNEFADGLYKYYLGNFYSLEAALIFKEYSGIKDSFIIAYYKGKRITINEAKKILEREE